MFFSKLNLRGYFWRDAAGLGSPLKPGIDPLRAFSDPHPVDVDKDAHYGRVLCPKEEGSSAFTFKKYDPLREFPALFLAFADLNLSEEPIAAFANRFGPLGVSVHFRGGVGGMQWGEPFEHWKREIEALRHAVDVWEAWKSKDLVKLGDLAGWKGGKLPPTNPMLLGEDSERERETGRTPSLRQWIVERSAWRDSRRELEELGLPGAAKLYLQRITDERFDALLRVGFEIKDDPSLERPFQRTYVPRSLLGALWLEFGNYLSEEREYERCDVCDTWFEIAPKQGTRGSRRYCSDACRFGAHPKRKRARELDSAGASTARIAAEIQVREEVVRRWLEK